MPPDALLRPVGPEPATVYWRRRAAVLGGALLLVLVLRGCADTGTDTAAVRPAPVGSPGVGGARPAVSVPPDASSTASPTPTPTPTAHPAGACADGVLALTATTDSRVYAAVALPRLSLVVENTGAQPCRADVGQAARELRVLSGPDRVWSSDDCAPGGDPESRLLQPRERTAYAVTWSRTRSRPGCTGDKEPARPGTYRVVARLGDRESVETVFTLR